MPRPSEMNAAPRKASCILLCVDEGSRQLCQLPSPLASRLRLLAQFVDVVPRLQIHHLVDHVTSFCEHLLVCADSFSHRQLGLLAVHLGLIVANICLRSGIIAHETFLVLFGLVISTKHLAMEGNEFLTLSRAIQCSMTARNSTGVHVVGAFTVPSFCPINNEIAILVIATVTRATRITRRRFPPLHALEGQRLLAGPLRRLLLQCRQGSPGAQPWCTLSGGGSSLAPGKLNTPAENCPKRRTKLLHFH
mmetsp:Transcript_131220/g.245553  ORF Transcript_131220/g.245553 Transcript_131220/m.245553 type:complete len:249 (+) Transcript_131220:76-822(+)